MELTYDLYTNKLNNEQFVIVFFTGLRQIVSKHNFTEQSLANLYIYQLLEKRADTTNECCYDVDCPLMNLYFSVYKAHHQITDARRDH